MTNILTWLQIRNPNGLSNAQALYRAIKAAAIMLLFSLLLGVPIGLLARHNDEVVNQLRAENATLHVQLGR
jgi:hypothetical protein